LQPIEQNILFKSVGSSFYKISNLNINAKTSDDRKTAGGCQTQLEKSTSQMETHEPPREKGGYAQQKKETS
jgi:hypothetical protein